MCRDAGAAVMHPLTQHAQDHSSGAQPWLALNADRPPSVPHRPSHERLVRQAEHRGSCIATPDRLVYAIPSTWTEVVSARGAGSVHCTQTVQALTLLTYECSVSRGDL